MYYHLVSQNTEIICSNLAEQCYECLERMDASSLMLKECSIHRKKSRLGKVIDEQGETFICANTTNLIKSTRIFKEKLYLYNSSKGDFYNLKKDILDDINADTKRLLHNLTSLNAHNIQEVYSLVPQELLTKNLSTQITIIKDFINKNSNDAAISFLRIAKNNAAMKTEFSVFKKLYETKPSLQSKYHPIRKVILNVLHIFFQDFTDNGIRVEVDNCTEMVCVDYESFSVSLYHLIENTTKYALPNSEVQISFNSNSGEFIVIFEMLSLEILPEEEKQIENEGYSGKNAKKIKKAGDGIGMFIIKKLLNLNGAKLLLKRNLNPEKEFSFNNFKYQKNVFEIQFPKGMHSSPKTK